MAFGRARTRAWRLAFAWLGAALALYCNAALAEVLPAAVPAWSPADAAIAVAEIRNAGARGLRPGDYDHDWLAREAAAPIEAMPAGRRVLFEAGLTRAMTQYLADLHQGRERARNAHRGIEHGDDGFDAAATLAAALRAHRIAEAVDSAQPRIPLYRRLIATLARYRALAREPWPPLAPPSTRRTDDAAATAARTAALAERLVALGDLPSEAFAGTAPDPAALAAALARFQRRHGLAADGVAGRQTIAALNVPPLARAEQIELALERLRWLPALPASALIGVNIPSYRLWAFAEGPGDETAEASMAVIVGRAVKTPTPVFLAQMRYLEFSPYWNVPPSIARNEIVPKLARDPGYLQRNAMELVGAGAAAPVTAATPQALQALRAGTLRVRQRPGPANALDGVKFAMPNPMNIYLHGTPARELFGRTRRDFSHGCIRVEDPVALAQFVLRDHPEWSEARIREAMAADDTRTVWLNAPIRVVIFYATAVVDRDGEAFFLDDVYGEDRKLRRTLAAGAPEPLPAPDAARVDVDEVRVEVAADAAAL